MQTPDLNPFLIRGYRGKEYFCDREAETKNLLRLLQNGNDVVLAAPRRIGKSGLIQHCFAQEELNGYYVFYVDVYSTRCFADFVALLGAEIAEKLNSKGKKALQRFWEVVSSLRAGISFDPMGEASLNIQVGDINQSKVTLKEIFDYLNSADRPCIIAIDEFQQITEYPEKNTEALLRTYIQKCNNAHFIFSGSHRHMMTQIFLSPSRPFYQSASHFSLDCIPLDVYTPFAQNLFVRGGKKLESDVMKAIYEEAEGLTWYVQKLLNELYSLTQKGEICTMDYIPIAMRNILDSYDNNYADLLHLLSSRQMSLLLAIAREGKATNVQSAAFIKRYKLTSASSVQSGIKTLLEKAYLTENSGKYYIYDLFLQRWLEHRKFIV